MTRRLSSRLLAMVCLFAAGVLILVPTSTAAPRPVFPGFEVRASLLRYRLPAPVYRTVAAVQGNAILVLGGIDSAGATISQVVRFFPRAGSVSRFGSLALPTHGDAALSIGGHVFLYGGASNYVYSTVQAFDPRSGATVLAGALPSPRADLAAALVGGRPVLLGGFNGYGPLQSVLIGNAAASGFRTLAELPQPVRYPAVAEAAGRVYLFGGLFEGGEYTGVFRDQIQRVETASRKAQIVGHLPLPLGHAKAVLLDGRILIVGGSSPRGPSRSIFAFDPTTGKVAVVGLLPLGLTDGALIAIGNLLVRGNLTERAGLRHRRPQSRPDEVASDTYDTSESLARSPRGIRTDEPCVARCGSG
jgi:hypothetical protein